MLWFTADLHFNHSRVIEYSQRPFADVNAMNEALIQHWVDCVNPSDDVYILGDFAFSVTGGWPLTDLFGRLPGRKHLIIGNHDERNAKVLKLPWSTTGHLSVVRHEGVRFVVCHYPLETWKNAAHGYLHLHGHSHGTLKRQIAHRFDVGVDVRGYTPVRWDSLVREAAMQVFDA